MTDDHADKADRLLELISSIYGQDDAKTSGEVPFSINKEGQVVLGDLLQQELEKTAHLDLKEWALNNIVQLFE